MTPPQEAQGRCDEHLPALPFPSPGAGAGDGTEETLRGSDIVLVDSLQSLEEAEGRIFPFLPQQQWRRRCW